jgi:hypothetical protein
MTLSSDSPASVASATGAAMATPATGGIHAVPSRNVGG